MRSELKERPTNQIPGELCFRSSAGSFPRENRRGEWLPARKARGLLASCLLPRESVRDAFLFRFAWVPVQHTCCFAVIGDEVFLVVRPPGKRGRVQLDVQFRLQIQQQLEQRHTVFVAASDIEGVPACQLPVFMRSQITGNSVGYMKEIAHLLTVSIDGKGVCGMIFGFECLLTEPADPTLIEG